MTLFEDRSRAESFGNVARLYDRARPTYPPELVDWLLSDGTRRVLDIGCGTGIAGGLFAARGCEVTGVKIDARMAAVARTKGFEVEVAFIATHSDHQALGDQQLGKLLDAVGTELDAAGGSFEYGYETMLVTATRA